MLESRINILWFQFQWLLVIELIIMNIFVNIHFFDQLILWNQILTYITLSIISFVVQWNFLIACNWTPSLKGTGPFQNVTYCFVIAIIVILILNLFLIWKNEGAFMIIEFFCQSISVLIIIWICFIELIQLIDILIWLSIPRIFNWINWVHLQSILFVNVLSRHLMLNFQWFFLHKILFFQKLKLLFRLFYFSIFLLKILLVFEFFIINNLLLSKFFLLDLILIDAFKF